VSYVQSFQNRNLIAEGERYVLSLFDKLFHFIVVAVFPQILGKQLLFSVYNKCVCSHFYGDGSNNASQKILGTKITYHIMFQNHYRPATMLWGFFIQELSRSAEGACPELAEGACPEFIEGLTYLNNGCKI